MQSSYYPLQLYSQFPTPDLYSWAIIPTIMDKNVDTFEENALYRHFQFNNFLSWKGNRFGDKLSRMRQWRCGPGSILTWCYMWVEFVVGSCLVPIGFFSRFSSFPHSKKPTSLNSNLTWIDDPCENQLMLMWFPH